MTTIELEYNTIGCHVSESQKKKISVGQLVLLFLLGALSGRNKWMGWMDGLMGHKCRLDESRATLNTPFDQLMDCG